jgi:phosphate-selective porin OprO/OprP
VIERSAGIAAPVRLVLLIITGIFAFADDAAAQMRDTIIRNVYIVQAESETDPAPVNIVIRNGKLALVTPDTVDAGNSQIRVLDGNGGFVLGRLTVGDVPAFLLLSEDPSANMDVLLDTRSYLTFAVSDGEIIRNELIDNQDLPPTDESPPQRWLAYHPPPFAILSNIEADKWNAFRSRWVNGILISALALDRQWIDQDADSIEQFPDLSDFERGTIRGWRFGVAGTINFDNPWTYNVAFAWNSFDRGFDTELDEFQFFDYSVSIPLSDSVTVNVGKQKEPINMDRSMTMVQIASQERYAAADAMFPTRNFGIVVNGTALNQRVSWAAGLFNDWLIEDESLDESSTQTVGRVTWLPFLSADESNLVHIGLGVRYTNAKQGLQYRSRPETGNAPIFVDTDLFDADSSTLYNWELGWRNGPLWLMAEYSDNHVDAPSVDNPRFSGYHLSGTWAFSREMRPYRSRSGVFGGLPIAQDVVQGGHGAWEMAVRYSSVDLTDGQIAGGEMDIATAQLNWWLTQSMALSLNYRRTWTDRFGLDGEMDAFVARVMLILQ